MRSFRTAAVAGASALALTFSGTAVATAQDGDDLIPDDNVTQEQAPIDQGGDEVPVEDYEPKPVEPSDEEPGLSSDINAGSSADLEADQPAQGPAIFGSSKDLDSQPRWAQLLYGASILGGLGSLIGVIVGPIVNFLNHGPQA